MLVDRVQADKVLSDWHLQHSSYEQDTRCITGEDCCYCSVQAWQRTWCQECFEADLQSLKQDGEGQHAICLSKCSYVHIQQCLDNWTE